VRGAAGVDVRVRGLGSSASLPTAANERREPVCVPFSGGAEVKRTLSRSRNEDTTGDGARGSPTTVNAQRSASGATNRTAAQDLVASSRGHRCDGLHT
jgi:hypothetical protein